MEGFGLIYVTGDMHAEFKRFYTKKLKKTDTLIICGDFGFIWSGTEQEKKTLKKIGTFPFKTLFIDGTHENFDLLSSYPLVEFAGGQAHQIYGNLFHLLRGQIYEIENKNFFTFGGGESTDKDDRILCEKWWAQEFPKIDEMKDAVKALNKFNRYVDYIITHEPPAKIKVLFCKNSGNINPLNRFFDEVSREVNYKKWFFGSTHENRNIANKYQSVFSDIIPLENTKGDYK